MNPGNKDKEDNAEKGRSLRSRRVNYTINEKKKQRRKSNHAERYHYR